jgi:hypothetical protein
MGLTAEPVPFKLRPGTPHIQKTGRALACLRMICRDAAPTTRPSEFKPAWGKSQPEQDIPREPIVAF